MNEATEKKGVISIEQVLAEEADAIGGDTLRMAHSLASELKGQNQHDTRTLLNADDRDRVEIDEAEVERRKGFYCSLNKLNRGAICCSGGGIRSATFCLGIVQALAGYDVKAKQWTAEVEPQNSFLGHFHYLSTVSGGGYFGSWLSSWRERDGFATVIANLTRRPRGPDVEPPEISWLRAYSNYLTPQLGIASADTWAAVAICARNLILNWLIIIPVACAAILALKIIATVSVWIAHGTHNDQLVIWILLFGIVFLIAAQAFTTRHRPPRRPKPPSAHPMTAVGGGKKPAKQPGNATQTFFLWGDLIWAVFSAIAVTVFFSSSYFWRQHAPGWPDGLILTTAGASVVIYALGWVFGLRLGRGWLVDFIFWALSGLVYGALVGLGAALFAYLQPYGSVPPYDPSNKILHLLVPIMFGVPWVLLAQVTADNIFGGLVSYESYSDSDREWLGRAAGWLAAVATAWALVALLVFAGDYFVLLLVQWGHKFVVAAGGVFAVISGIATALLGKSSLTPAKSSSDDQDSFAALACNIVMAVAGPIFAAALIIALSIGLDKVLLDDSLIKELQGFTDRVSVWPILTPLLIGAAVTVAIGLIASYFVNINRFSLHALYRNRLIRAYLGASRPVRSPDLFTGMDPDDNIRVHELWSEKSAKNVHRLFHVINIALNVVSTKRLAWQERKAMSFTVSPLHCGSAYLGFRSSTEYGDGPKTEQAEQEFKKGERKFGIALGTAMAISGAAVSPNMGYNSSPSITLLLALFNLRLGWWLGNPGEAGNRSYDTEGPLFAAIPLFAEVLGLTTDKRRYVYLSDGGHFEDLGLYEMVRRRCRFIIVIDAGEDGKFAFGDLGNAVRKIYIDLGIQITFKGLESLADRPSPEAYSRTVRDAAALASLGTADAIAKGIKAAGSKIAVPGETPYYAIGTIDYEDADRIKPGDNSGPAKNGTILYIKPAYHGTETSAGIRSYAMAHSDFPHETTVDQWFTESQFESYRSLGLEIGNKVLRDSNVKAILESFLGDARAHAATAS
jgi:hypothetical protein